MENRKVCLSQRSGFTRVCADYLKVLSSTTRLNFDLCWKFFSYNAANGLHWPGKQYFHCMWLPNVIQLLKYVFNLGMQNIFTEYFIFFLKFNFGVKDLLWNGEGGGGGYASYFQLFTLFFLTLNKKMFNQLFSNALTFSFNSWLSHIG